MASGGTYKTFAAFDLSGCVMAGVPFAGRDVVRRGGVLFIASEGQDEVRIRLSAIADEKVLPSEAAGINADRLPFAWHEECPQLTNADALPKLRKIVARTATTMRERYNVELAVIIIDTLMASAGFKDANDAAEAQRVMDVLKAIGREFGLFVIAVDHFGKDVSTGTRNSSAKEGAADAVLALLSERDLAGNVVNPRLAIGKVRGAPTGETINLKPRVVQVGHGADAGTTIVIDWAATDAAAHQPRPAARDRSWPRSLKIFKAALDETLGWHDESRRPFTDNLEVRAVDRTKVRDEFMRRYPADNDKAKGEAFRRCEKDAVNRGAMGAREIGGRTLFWLIADDPRRP